MTKLDATLALTKLISPFNNNPKEIEESVMRYSEDNWVKIIEVANNDTLIPLLYQSLKHKDLYKYIHDSILKEYLKEFYELNATRNIAIVKQLEEICSILKSIDVKPVLLKGAAALTESHYQNIGERVMSDIDFYVPEEQIFKSIELLKSNGYLELNPSSRLDTDWHHYRRMYRDDIPASVEIHRFLLNRNCMHYFPKIDESKMFIQSKTIKNAYVLAPTYELYHSFLHTEISHFFYLQKHLAIRHLQHFSVLVMLNKENIDFEYLKLISKQHNINNIWNGYLKIQNYFFDLKTSEKFIENQETAQHLADIQYKILNANTTFIKLKTAIKKIQYALGYINLQKNYTFNSRWMMLIYVPHRTIHLMYLYVMDKKKRDNFHESISNLAS